MNVHFFWTKDRVSKPTQVFYLLLTTIARKLSYPKTFNLIMFPFLIVYDFKGGYDQNSIRMACTFVENCQNIVDKSGSVWIAFQVNVTHDNTRVDPSFTRDFETLKQDLLRKGVHLSNLSSHLLSTKDIVDCANNVASFPTTHAFNKMTNIVSTIPSKFDVRSVPVLYIPMLFEQHKEHFRQTLQTSIERLKKHIERNDQLCVVLLYNPRCLSTKYVHQALKDNSQKGIKIIMHPQKCNNDSIDPLKDFLRNPVGIYAVPDSNFGGMEAKSVIYCLHNDFDAKDYNITSIRSHLSRAVSELCVIHPFDINSYLYENTFLFDYVEVDSSYLQCTKEMKYWAFTCNSHEMHLRCDDEKFKIHSDVEKYSPSRNSQMICPSCIITCHWNHKKRSGIKFGGSPYSSNRDFYDMIKADRDRRKSCSIFGEEKCSCSQMMNCKFTRTRRVSQ